MATEDDPGQYIDQHVKDNYDELHRQGREWVPMADEAERMNDHKLAGYLRSRAVGDKAPDPKAKPQGRTTPAGAKTNG